MCIVNQSAIKLSLENSELDVLVVKMKLSTLQGYVVARGLMFFVAI